MACKEEPKGPKPPLAGLMLLKINWTGPGTPTPIAANLLHARWNDSVNHSNADLTAVLASFRTAVTTNIIPLVNNAWTASSFVAQSLGGDGQLASNASSATGTKAGNSLQPSVAVCASWLSTATWRGGRPRTYIPGPSNLDTAVIGGAALLSSSATAYKNGFAAFLTAVNAILASGIGIAMGFPSYFTHCQFRPVPIFYPFTGVVVHDRLDSQRRRSGKERYFALS